MKIEFDSMTLTPWPDIARLLTSMKTLAVKAGGTVYSGPASLSTDDHGNCVLEIGPKGPKVVKAPEEPKKSRTKRVPKREGEDA